MVKKGSGTPPYVPRKGLKAVLDQIQAHKAGEMLAREDLHKRGLSSHWTYPALAALRFLGILDESDRLTGRHTAFDRERPDLQAQQTLLREAYSEFFEQVELPVPDDETLRRKFQEIYKLSERVANSAFPIFEMLTAEAGLQLTARPASGETRGEKEERPSPDRPGEPAAADDASDAELLQRMGREDPVRIRHTGYQIVINLQVNKYTTEKDLIKMVKTANRAIHLLKKAGDSH